MEQKLIELIIIIILLTFIFLLFKTFKCRKKEKKFLELEKLAISEIINEINYLKSENEFNILFEKLNSNKSYTIDNNFSDKQIIELLEEYFIHNFINIIKKYNNLKFIKNTFIIEKKKLFIFQKIFYLKLILSNYTLSKINKIEKLINEHTGLLQEKADKMGAFYDHKNTFYCIDLKGRYIS